MRMVVCIKQVPYVDRLKFDAATKRLIRDGVESEINPFDKRAITQAVELKKQFGGEVVVVTMGPPQAKDALAEAIAMGCDRAVHLLGKEFAGADTLVTARALARACQKIGFDVIFCGKYSTDAETAQVPPMLAEFLDVPQITGVTQLTIDGRRLTATRELDDGFETVETSLPAVLSTAERLVKPARVTPEQVEAAKQKPVEIWEPSALGEIGQFGIAGSPTWVTDIYSIEPKRKCVIRALDENADAVAQAVVRDLLTEGLFSGWKSRAPEPFSPGEQNLQGESIWVVAETVGGTPSVRPVTFELLGRAVQLAERINGNVTAVLWGHNVSHLAKSLAAYGAARVFFADDAALALYSTETHTAILADAIRAHDPYAVLIPSTANGRDLAPRVAARLNIGLTGDVIGLEIDAEKRLVQLKPAFGGNLIAPILTKTRPAMATIRPGILSSAVPDPSRKAALEKLPLDTVPAPRARVLVQETSASVGIELDNAPVVVAVGMGIGAPENLPIVRELAATLKAPLAATRKVVDAGWLPRQAQIGITGRSIAPRMYVAIGLSGKFNHVVGMQRAGLVLAINNNPEAEIFKQADFGIVGDWAIITPALTRALKRVKQ